MKGDFAGAADKLSERSDVAFVALDATAETVIGTRYGIDSYPKLKYFRLGRFVEDFKGARKKMDFVGFLKKKLLQEKQEL